MVLQPIEDRPTLRTSLDSVSLVSLYQQFWSDQDRRDKRERYSVTGTVDFDEWKPFPFKNYKEYFTDPSRTYQVMFPVNLIDSCPSYNRTEVISPESCDHNLKYAGNKFNFDNTEAITIFYDPINNKFRTTRGNHRTLMMMLAEGTDALIQAKVKVHYPDATEDEMLMREADNFDADNQFNGMTNQQKFKGQLFHELSGVGEDTWAKDLYDFLNGCNPKIGIANMNTEAEIEIDAYAQLRKLLPLYKDEGALGSLENSFMREIIESVAKYGTSSKDGQIRMTLIRSMAEFKSKFKSTLSRVALKNESKFGKDKTASLSALWKDFMIYIFEGRGEIPLPLFQKLTQKELIRSNSAVRVTEYHIATLATLFNEYVSMNQLKYHGNKETHGSAAISETDSAWKKMLETVPKNLHSMVNGNLKAFFV